MNSWKIILATVVIFGAGVVTGGLLVNYVINTHPKNFHHAPAEVEHPATGDHDHDQQHPPEFPMPQASRMSKQFMQQLDDKLKLSPEQHAAIEKIIADGQERNHAIWTNVAPQMRKVMQDVNQQIREQLTADQQKEFEELMKHPPRRPSNSTNAPPVLSSTNEPPKAP